MIIARILRRLVTGTIRGMVYRWPTTLLALILIGGATLFLGSRGLVPGLPTVADLPSVPWMSGSGSPSGTTSTDAREMMIEDLRPDRANQQITLVLKEKSGNRRLVMAVGQSEALAIASDLNNRRSNNDRPMTYDLMRSIVQQLGGTLDRVVVSNVNETSFFAKVVLTTDNRQVEVESSPSDAIALALRSKVPIFAEASVLDKAGVLNPR